MFQAGNKVVVIVDRLALMEMLLMRRGDLEEAAEIVGV